ncbi:uncharacterized protein [Scyliorhinus torazame]|uniref:uncharacterized protein n=1 Tax=Scyliorhinus torazame TaxID=75743 RepID=UPI003B5C8992
MAAVLVLVHLILLWMGQASVIWNPTQVINATIKKPIVLSPRLRAHPEIIQWAYRKTNSDSSVTLCEKLGNKSRICLSQFATRMNLNHLYELTIFSVQPSDSGLYRAVVWYIWDETDRNLIQLAVYDAIFNLTIIVTRGLDYTSCILQCVASSGTGIIFKWMSNDASVTTDEFHNITGNGAALSIATADLLPLNQNIYICIASNPVSTASADIDLRSDCRTGTELMLLPTWAIVVLCLFSLFIGFVMFLCACFFWCRDVRWFLRCRRAWFNPPQTQYPTISSTPGSMHSSTRRKAFDRNEDPS